jgi:hypothetical protein
MTFRSIDTFFPQFKKKKRLLYETRIGYHKIQRLGNHDDELNAAMKFLWFYPEEVPGWVFITIYESACVTWISNNSWTGYQFRNNLLLSSYPELSIVVADHLHINEYSPSIFDTPLEIERFANLNIFSPLLFLYAFCFDQSLRAGEQMWFLMDS